MSQVKTMSDALHGGVASSNRPRASPYGLRLRIRSSSPPLIPDRSSMRTRICWVPSGAFGRRVEKMPRAENDVAFHVAGQRDPHLVSGAPDLVPVSILEPHLD